MIMRKSLTVGLSNRRVRLQCATVTRSIEEIKALLDKGGKETAPKPIRVPDIIKPTSTRKISANTSTNSKENFEPSEKRPKFNNSGKRYFIVLWGKATTKKHKTFENDGIIQVDSKIAKLMDMDGKSIGTTTNISKIMFESGVMFKIGGNEVQIIDPCDEPHFGSEVAGYVNS